MVTSPARLREPKVVSPIGRRDPTTVAVKAAHGSHEVKLSVRNLRHVVLNRALLRAEGEAAVTGFEGLALVVGGRVVAVIIGALVLDHLADGFAVAEVDLGSLVLSDQEDRGLLIHLHPCTPRGDRRTAWGPWCQ